MQRSYIWVHKQTAELDGETGFIECDSDIAEKLIAEDKAQDPSCGAHYLREITYETKVMAPRKTASARKTQE